MNRRPMTFAIPVIALAVALIGLLWGLSAVENGNAASPITVSFNGSGTINGVPVTIVGNGFADPDTGIAVGDIDVSPVPPNFAVCGITVVIFTWKNQMASKEMSGGINMLTLTDGNFGGERTTVSLDTSGSLFMTAQLERTGPTSVDGTFTIDGDVLIPPMPVADTLRSFIETWTPAGPGKIDGHLVAPYVADDGSRLRMDITTSYAFDPSIELPFPEERRLDVSYVQTSATSCHVEYDVTIQPSSVGGTTELVVDDSAATAENAGSTNDSTLPIAAAAGGVLAVLVGGTWFVRRRFVR